MLPLGENIASVPSWSEALLFSNPPNLLNREAYLDAKLRNKFDIAIILCPYN